MWFFVPPSPDFIPPKSSGVMGLKKTQVELELLTNIDMLLMVEKGIRGWIFQAIHRYAKANNKYTKNYDQDKE